MALGSVGDRLPCKPWRCLTSEQMLSHLMSSAWQKCSGAVNVSMCILSWAFNYVSGSIKGCGECPCKLGGHISPHIDLHDACISQNYWTICEDCPKTIRNDLNNHVLLVRLYAFGDHDEGWVVFYCTSEQTLGPWLKNGGIKQLFFQDTLTVDIDRVISMQKEIYCFSHLHHSHEICCTKMIIGFHCLAAEENISISYLSI